MDKRSRWMVLLWKLLIFIPILNLVSACPTQCTCTKFLGNSVLRNLLLSDHARNVTEELVVSCMNHSLTEIPKDLPIETIFLDVCHNRLVTIGNINQNLSSLRTVDLSHNRIISLDGQNFQSLVNLQKLILADNRIGEIIDQSFHNLSHVEYLDVSGNRLTALENETLSGLSGLRMLNASRNRISVIKGQTFRDVGRIQILDLSYNSLEDLHLHMFRGLNDLRTLNLSHNFINYISSQVFTTLHRLEVLDLSHNVLRTTSAFMFDGLTALHYLDLSGNILHTLSDLTFNNTKNLRILHLDHNPIPQFNIPVFTQLYKLETVTLTNLPYLTNLAHDTFMGLHNLKHLNLSSNPRLAFLNPHLFSPLPELQTIDLHGNNISYLSALTFHFNPNLTHADLTHNPLVCNCDIAWLAQMIQKNNSIFGSDLLTCAISGDELIPITQVNNDTFPCAEVLTQNVSATNQKFYFKLGSTARLYCNISMDSTMVLIWKTSRNKILTYHAFHPDAIKHLPDPDYTGIERDWINSTVYHSEMVNRQDRVTLLSDGSLFIDYVMRSDTGPYQCEVRNAYHNVSQTVFLWLNQNCLYQVQMWSMIIGVSCATSFFILILVYTVIRQCTIRVINKRRRDAIRQFLENIDHYKRTQITRIRENYSIQVTRVSEHYHNQLERLRSNYSMQMGRVKRGCSHQVDKIRDNYGIQKGRLKDYSSHQIEQIRTAYNNQLLRIRDYGLLQFDRLRETCKLQQQNVLKILETMNIENCKSVIETECTRTESMIFEPPFVHDDIQGLSLIGSESDYMTASDDSKSNASATQEVNIGTPSSDVSLDVEDVLDPLPLDDGDLFRNNDITRRNDLAVVPDVDLGDISLHTIT